jgi:hypothetical protein
MKTVTLTLTDKEIWLLNAWRTKLTEDEKKTKTPEGQPTLALLNRFLKAIAEGK